MMDYYILNPVSFNADGIIQNITSVVWNCQFFGLSEFEMSLPANGANMKLCNVGCFIARASDFDGTEFRNVMVIEKKVLSFGEEVGWSIKISGGGLKSLLNLRVIWEQVTRSGSVEQCIYEVVRLNAVAPEDSTRTIPNLVIGESVGLEYTADIQVFSERIGDWIESVAQQYGFGWDMYIDVTNGRIVFQLKVGEDRTSESESPVIFSEDFDNLYSCEYTYDKSTYFNTGLVGGEGDGINQRTAQAGGGTHLNRRETYIDGTSVSSNGDIITLETYMEMLRNYGSESLSQYSVAKSFTCNVDPNGMFTYGTDFSLGDIVEIDTAGVVASARITEVIYSEDSSGEKMTLTLGETEVD